MEYKNNKNNPEDKQNLYNITSGSYKINLNNENNSNSQNTTMNSENNLITGNKLFPGTENSNNNSNVYSDYSFPNFIKMNLQKNLNLNASWNREKENFVREQNNKRKIILKEINQFDFNDPLKTLDDAYIKDVYNTNLLVNELKDLDSIFSERTFTMIIDKKGNLDVVKKIIEYYMNYVVEMNFESIMKALKKLNLIEINLEMSYSKVLQLKNKMKSIKQNFLISSSKFLLLKQKLKNMLQIHLMIKSKLLRWRDLFIQSKKLKSENKFCLLWSNLITIRNEIQNWTSNNTYNTNLIQNKSNDSFIFKKRNLLINEILLQKSKDKINKLQDHVEKQINNIFFEKKDNIVQCYDFFMLNPNHTNDKFLELIEGVYKKAIFNVIKGTLTSFTEESKSYLVQDIKKIKDIARLKFDENKFIAGMNQLVKNLSKICQCYNNITSGDNKVNLLFKSKNNIFYEKIEKKYAKVLQTFSNLIRELNYKNMIYLVVINCLFSELIKFYFKVDYSKYIILQVKSLVSESIKIRNIQNIKKVGILLGGDNWKRAALQDYNEFFSQTKLQEKMPFFVRNFLTIFNDVYFFVNKNNIKDVFAKYIEVFTISTDKSSSNLPHLLSTNFSDEIKLEILSKTLNNKTIILSSSTITLIKYLVDLISDLAFFDSITYEIFTQIFNLIDYYIFAALNMFIDKKYLSQLFEEINLEEIKKKSKYEQGVELILFQKRFSNLRKFLISTKKNLEILFEVEIDLIKSTYDSNENYESGEFYLPKMNSQIIINDNNIYTCMIESIILYESMVSIKKVLKRLTHFSKKIELEFQSKIITDNIKTYDVILDEIKVFIYKPICQNIFKIDPILNKIGNYKWDPKEAESDFEFSEANLFIDNIFQEICEKYDKLYLLSAGSLTEKSQMRFLDVIIIQVIEKLMDAFSKIKKCNSWGRSIMLKDIKFLKSKIECKYGKDFHNVFGELELYINSWYCGEDEFLKYIEDTHLNYKFLNGVLNTGQNFTKQTRQQRKDFLTKLDETYLSVMENIKISMLE